MNDDAITLTARRLAEDARGVPRADARVWHLSDEHFCSVVEWMLAAVPVMRIRQLCEAELQLPPAKVPGRTALSEFWAEFWPYYVSCRRKSNVAAANAMDAEIDKAPLNVDRVLRDEIKQRALELLGVPNPPEKLIKAFVNAVLKMRDQDDRQEQRELEREKFAAAQRSKIEAGLEALRVEIANNAKAMKQWEQLKLALN